MRKILFATAATLAMVGGSSMALAQSFTLPPRAGLVSSGDNPYIARQMISTRVTPFGRVAR